MDSFKYPSIWIRDQILRYLKFKGQNCQNVHISNFSFFDFGKHCVPPGCVQEQEQQENSLKLCVRCVWSGLQGMRIVTIPLAKPNFRQQNTQTVFWQVMNITESNEKKTLQTCSFWGKPWGLVLGEGRLPFGLWHPSHCKRCVSRTSRPGPTAFNCWLISRAGVSAHKLESVGVGSKNGTV